MGNPERLGLLLNIMQGLLRAAWFSGGAWALQGA